MSPRVYSSARERIIDAAERLIRAGGASQLSVEEVAREAKVSKGGFFHHFASKDDLLVALLDRAMGEVDAEVKARAAGDPEPRGAMLRAQIALAFDLGKATYEQWLTLILAFIQVAGTGSALMRRGQQITQEALARDEAQDIPVGRAIAIQFALDGYAFAVAVGGLKLTPKQRDAFRDSLMVLARPEARPPPRSRRRR